MLDPTVDRSLAETAAVPKLFVVAFDNKIALRTLFERLKAAETVATPAWALCFLHSLMPRIQRGFNVFGSYMMTTSMTRRYMEKAFGWEWTSQPSMEDEWEQDDLAQP
jgi:hypothetical protein